jgi:predicted kinase
MGSLTIITGSPGAGKTTLAARLADQSPRGAHVVGDSFYTFLAHPLNPALPEAHQQNAAVITATVRAAAALAQGGYDVFLDGIFGPWFLPLILKELPVPDLDVDYVVLRVTLDEALRRVAARQGQHEENVIRQMHSAFCDLGPYERHALETTRMTTDEVAAQFTKMCATLRLVP